MRFRLLAMVALSLCVSTAAGQDPSWREMSVKHAPTVREAGTLLDADGRLIVWGGAVYGPDGTGRYLGDGAVYDPEGDTWQPMTSVGAPAARAWHSAIWTGSEMIIWGGQSEHEVADGAAYDPLEDRWRKISSKAAPRARVEHSACWDGSRMLVWSGVTEERSFTDGASYDPERDAWTPIPAAPLPFGRRSHAAHLIGGRLLIWGGINGGSVLGDGAIYEPATEGWTGIPASDSLTARGYPGSLVLGEQLVVWGGSGGVYGRTARGDGAILDSAQRAWTAITAEGSPSARFDHVFQPCSPGFLVWGGRVGEERQRDGAIYDIVARSWQPIPPAPRATPFQAAVRRGERLTLLAWDPATAWGRRLDLDLAEGR